MCAWSNYTEFLDQQMKFGPVAQLIAIDCTPTEDDRVEITLKDRLLTILQGKELVNEFSETIDHNPGSSC